MNADRWMDIAKKEIGICEIVGIAHEKRIIDYHSCTSLKAQTDEVPWCASFVCWVLKSAGIKHTRSAAAISFLEWGEEIFEPKFGAVALFERPGGTGHVGFVFSATDKTINLLGGNQGNQVGVRPYSKEKLISLRWPKEDMFFGS